MTSLFESIEQVTDVLPPSMVVEIVPFNSRGVAPLEFIAIDARPEVFEPSPDVAAPTDKDERVFQMRVMIEAARSEAALEARRECLCEYELRSIAERARVDLLFIESARDHKRFIAEAETQVVRLAMAIARKILAREAASDPMHLSAIVKAALARIHDSSASTLRVSPVHLEAWQSLFFELEPHLQITGDERLEGDSVVLETTVGHVDFGIRAQMEEVERGLEELMQRCAE
jgi:flagellar assembly protein FliH